MKMPVGQPPIVVARRALGSVGSLLAGSAVALSAYAAHGAEAGARAQLLQSAAFAFGHGLALAALSPVVQRRLGLVAMGLLLLGTLLFSGSLVGTVLFGLPGRLAPFGGSLMIAGWLLHASDRLRG